jgi:hypothetical protein
MKEFEYKFRVDINIIYGRSLLKNDILICCSDIISPDNGFDELIRIAIKDYLNIQYRTNYKSL